MFPVSIQEKVPNQLGVRGSGRPGYVGFNLAPIYVNQDHPNASDDNEYSTPDRPFLTVQAALDKAADFQTIYIHSSESPYTETLVMDATYADHLNIVGIGQPQLRADTAGPILTTVNAVHLENLRLSNLNAACDGVSMLVLNANGTNGSIKDCVFLGNDAELYAISATGDALVGWDITGNRFFGGGITTSTVIKTGTTMEVCRLEDNYFYNYETLIELGDSPGLEIKDNTFSTAVTYLDVSAGSTETVTGNYFEGTYSIAGGYAGAGAGQLWAGNYVEAGITAAQPA